MNSSVAYQIPKLPLAEDLENKKIFKQLAKAHSLLGELRGAADKIPNKNILIHSLTLMEAKESSSVENIVTTHDELYQADLNIKEYTISASTKEVMNYRKAIRSGFELIQENGFLTNSIIKQIQQDLEGNSAGFRTVPGTTLQDGSKRVIYTPPQDARVIEEMMNNLELFINDDSLSDLDSLTKMAIIHHQFESIHPFLDGNGRTGRIICILYLVAKGLLTLPILYLSRYITHNKTEYYRLLQAVRESEQSEELWREWIHFMLVGVADTAKSTLSLIEGMNQLMQEYKTILKPLFGKTYKHDLINNLFYHPYTKIEFIERDMMVQRKTATKYLQMIESQGLIRKMKIGKTNYYINTKLVDLFVNHESDRENDDSFNIIESVSLMGLI